MYEELVKRLRDRANLVREYNESGKLFDEAADAIEELQKALGSVNDAHNEGYDVGYWAGRRDYEPKWISVTERLPKSGDTVLAYCRVKLKNGNGRGYVCNAFYSAPKTEQRSTEYDDIDLEYDEETDEYYLPEGWWEQIYNWGEYGFVEIADFVTHWMPLPEPPKEE